MKKWIQILLAALCSVILCCASTPVLAEESEEGGGGPTKYVALTFDDGPTGELTEQLLDGLRKRYVSATFFLCGYRIEQFPDVVRDMAADGHELGIHGQTHAYLHKLPQAQIREELETTGNLIEELTGERAHVFRPPGGLISDALLAETTREQLPIILWAIDPEDWKCQNASCVVQRITAHVQDGDVILMHDLSKSSVAAAFQVIDLLERQGFEFCTVSELAALRGTTLEPSASYLHFPPSDTAKRAAASQ